MGPWKLTRKEGYNGSEKQNLYCRNLIQTWEIFPGSWEKKCKFKEKAHTMKVKVIDMQIENQWFIFRIIGVPWRQKQKQWGWKPWSKENYMELGEGSGRCRLIWFLTFQSKAMLRDQHPMVCWRKLILACEGWFLNLQKFYELVIKCSHYEKWKAINLQLSVTLTVKYWKHALTHIHWFSC